MEALRLCEIFVPPVFRGFYQVILEAVTVALAELSESGKKTSEEHGEAPLGEDEQT